MSELTRKSTFRPLLATSAISLTSYFVGISTWSLSWSVGFGAAALFLAETGRFFAADYYHHKRRRGSPTPAPSLSAMIEPPQLVLKGAWGFYLLAFLFSLLLAISLDQRGWMISLFAFAGFFLGYYGKGWIAAVGSTFVPFGAAITIVGGTIHWRMVSWILLLYGIRVALSLFNPSFYDRT